MKIATNIIWDEDDKYVLSQLPEKIVIPAEIENDEDRISDYISDFTGYCHKGFQIETIKYYYEIFLDFSLDFDTKELVLVGTNGEMDFSSEDEAIIDAKKYIKEHLIEEYKRPFKDFEIKVVPSFDINLIYLDNWCKNLSSEDIYLKIKLSKLSNIRGFKFDEDFIDFINSNKTKYYPKIETYIMNNISKYKEFILKATYDLYKNNLIKSKTDWAAGLYNYDEIYIKAIINSIAKVDL